MKTSCHRLEDRNNKYLRNVGNTACYHREKWITLPLKGRGKPETFHT